MPWKWKSPCAVPGCPAMAARRGRCEVHYIAQRKSYDDGRPTAAARGYDAEWSRTRKAFLNAYRGCAVCGFPAKDVHHVVPLSAGGTHDWDNLQALCRQHHNEITHGGK